MRGLRHTEVSDLLKVPKSGSNPGSHSRPLCQTDWFSRRQRRGVQNLRCGRRQGPGGDNFQERLSSMQTAEAVLLGVSSAIQNKLCLCDTAESHTGTRMAEVLRWPNQVSYSWICYRTIIMFWMSLTVSKKKSISIQKEANCSYRELIRLVFPAEAKTIKSLIVFCCHLKIISDMLKQQRRTKSKNLNRKTTDCQVLVHWQSRKATDASWTTMQWGGVNWTPGQQVPSSRPRAQFPPPWCSPHNT